MWTPTTDAKYGIAVYNFDGKVKHGLPLEIGETVQMLEEFPGWYRGFSTRNKNNKGIFPSAYIHIKPCTVDNRGPYETVTPVEDPIVKEVAYVLREWSAIWKRYCIERKMELFELFKGVMLDLIEWRKELISGKLTLEQKNELKAKITVKVDWGNGRLGLDLVPRNPNTSEQVDAERISTVDLYRVHRTSAQHSRLASEKMGIKESRADASLSRSSFYLSHVKMGIKEAREDGRARSCFYVQNRSGSIRPQDDRFRGLTHHIHMVLTNVNCSLLEETEVYFALYDAKSNKFFSERFLAKLTKSGQAINKDRDYRYATLFTDLGDDDLERDAYLVAQVYRIGSLAPGESTKKAPRTHYKRPYGSGVISLREVLGAGAGLLQEVDNEQESILRVENCSESDFPQAHEHRISKQNAKFQLSSTSNYGLVISMKLLHNDLNKVRKEHPLLFARGVAITRKLGFSDVIMPGDVRNDLYLTLDRGEFERGGKSAGKNIEVRVMILDAEGNKVPGCISVGSGDTPVTEINGVIFYHNNSPKWNETFKLTIPIDKFSQPRAHFRIEFRHCSTRDKTEKKLFGFAFAKMMADNGTTITDGLHELYLYKCEDVSKLKCADSYLGLPSSPNELNPELGTTQGNVFFQRSQREMVYVETLLCSTKLTQNVDLLGLLKWHGHPDKVEEYLNKLLRLEGEEIVKYLQDILDALFTMFTAETEILPDPQLVFHALIFIFTLLQGRKFAQFQPVLEAYLTDHFFDPLVYRHLLTCLKTKVEVIPTSEKQEALQNAFRVLEYIFKFIVQSRLLCARHMASQAQDDFRTGLNDVLNAMYKVLSLNVEVITRTQCELLRNVPKLYPHLLKLLTPEELSIIVSTLIGKIHKDHLPEIGQVKLECLKETINSELFKRKESRGRLLPMCMSQLKRYMINKHELKLCTHILGDILDTLHKQQQEQTSHLHEEIHILVSAMLDVVVQAVFTVDKTHHVAGQLVACLIDMLHLMTENHYRAVLDGYKDRKPLKDFLLRVLTVFRELVRNDVFPRDWMVMRMVTNNVILNATQYFSQSLSEHFLQNGDFDSQLWTSYFNLAVYFLTQPSLQLEQFTEAKREKIIEKYGDMRVRTGFEILAMWQLLGDHKIHFIPGMVGPFLEVTLVPESELRKATLPIFFDMMECEQRELGNFKKVESELIDKLDILISGNKGDDEYRQLFNTILMGKVHSDPLWQENGTAFIQSVTCLLERLLDYRNVMEGDENRDKRMTCTVNLLNFYKNEFNRQEMYVRYIYKLCDLHLAAENFVEAGFTLLLHADLLNWNDSILHADMKYPIQPEWERKETIYLEVIQYMNRGKCWENGLPLCKELAQLYEHKFKYAKLRDILNMQAVFLDNILREMRLEPEYFRVGFYGQSFPLFLRNKEFVYRGLEFEKLSSFQQRLQMEFPSATLLGSNNKPSDNIRQGDSQCIQICNVKPIVDIESRFQNQDVSNKIKKFYLANEVDEFVYDRPFHRGEKNDKNEFKTLCLERTNLKIASKLPGILRWFEVVTSETVQLSPVETAISSISQMHKQVGDLVCDYMHEPKLNLAPLTMRLQGVLDAAVNGGILKYQTAFFSEEFTTNFPEHAHHVLQLKQLFQEELKLMNEALTLHGRLASMEIKPLHNRLMECFVTMRKNLRDSGSPKVTRLSNASVSSKKSDSWADATGSVSSGSSSLTPTPPGSNRSSGVGSGSTSDNNESDAIYSRPAEPTLPNSNSPRSNGANQGFRQVGLQRPKSAIFTRTVDFCDTVQTQEYFSNTSPRVKRNKTAKGPRISSDPTIGNKVDELAKDGSLGASSRSLDSAVSQSGQKKAHPSVSIRRENSMPTFSPANPEDTPPRLPPRKASALSPPEDLVKSVNPAEAVEETPPKLPARTNRPHHAVSFKQPSSSPNMSLYECLPISAERTNFIPEEPRGSESPPPLAPRSGRVAASTIYANRETVLQGLGDTGPAPPIPPKARPSPRQSSKYIVNSSPASTPSTPRSLASSFTESPAMNADIQSPQSSADAPTSIGNVDTRTPPAVPARVPSFKSPTPTVQENSVDTPVSVEPRQSNVRNLIKSFMASEAPADTVVPSNKPASPSPGNEASTLSNEVPEPEKG